LRPEVRWGIGESRFALARRRKVARTGLYSRLSPTQQHRQRERLAADDDMLVVTERFRLISAVAD